MCVELNPGQPAGSDDKRPAILDTCDRVHADMNKGENSVPRWISDEWVGRGEDSRIYLDGLYAAYASAYLGMEKTLSDIRSAITRAEMDAAMSRTIINKERALTIDDIRGIMSEIREAVEFGIDDAIATEKQRRSERE